jgi:hypothetical protein
MGNIALLVWALGSHIAYGTAQLNQDLLLPEGEFCVLPFMIKRNDHVLDLFNVPTAEHDEKRSLSV